MTELKAGFFDGDSKMKKAASRYARMLNALRLKEVNAEVRDKINSFTSDLNEQATVPSVSRKINRSYAKALSILEKQHGYIPPKTHFVRWMAIGMAAFGTPLGVIMGLILDNMAFLGVFIGVGLAIGLSVGLSLDKKAESEGKVLDVESM